MESLKKIKMNQTLLKEIRQTDNYPKYMKDLVANKQLTEDNDEVRMSPRCLISSTNHLPLINENDPGSFILPCSIRRLDFNNALADLSTSISIIPFSMFKRLGIGKLEPINMVIEMADDTKMPVILGRPLLATAHAKVDIFRKTISLEVGNEKFDRSRSANKGLSVKHLTSTEEEYSLVYPILARKSENNGKRTDVEWENLSLNDWLRIRFGELETLVKILGWMWESRRNNFLGTIINKLHVEWFKGTDKDDDYLEGITDYLKPTLYNGFIDSDDEQYKERKCGLLGLMPLHQ
ncbi:hypothetical protein Tco_1327811 [Tanacetum coccineum]